MLHYHPNIRRCEHIKVNGTQCGSPSLRKKKHCFFHEQWRQQRLNIADSVAEIPAGVSIAPALNLPVLEDANSVQLAIMQIMGLLLTRQIEHKTAALLLYGLQTASGNLRHAQFEPYPPKVVIDPATVDDTLMGEDQWDNSDFDDIEEEDGDEEDTYDEETDDEESDDEETDDEDDKNNSLQENAVLALEEHPSATVSNGGLDPLPDNWRDDVRTKITAMVKHAASSGGWKDELRKMQKS